MEVNPSYSKGDAFQVEQVRWEDCQEFCEKSRLTLPTEAQWEYACRAGTSGPFAGTGNLDDMGWYDKNSGRTPHPVGEKQANDFGLHDMHGNVWEWCEDWYQKDFYQESTDARDPLCATPGSEDENSGFEKRVVRGGSWCDDAQLCRSASRRPALPLTRAGNFGFRPAWSSP